VLGLLLKSLPRHLLLQGSLYFESYLSHNLCVLIHLVADHRQTRYCAWWCCISCCKDYHALGCTLNPGVMVYEQASKQADSKLCWPVVLYIYEKTPVWVLKTRLQLSWFQFQFYVLMPLGIWFQVQFFPPKKTQFWFQFQFWPSDSIPQFQFLLTQI